MIGLKILFILVEGRYWKIGFTATREVGESIFTQADDMNALREGGT